MGRGLRIKNRRSRIEEPGTRIKDQGSVNRESSEKKNKTKKKQENHEVPSVQDIAVWLTNKRTDYMDRSLVFDEVVY